MIEKRLLSHDQILSALGCNPCAYAETHWTINIDKKKKFEEFSKYLFGFCMLPSTILVVAIMPTSGTLKDNYGYKCFELT